MDQPESQEEGRIGRQSAGSRACGVVGCLLIIGLFFGLGLGVLAINNALEPLFDRFVWAPHESVREYLTAYDDENYERARRFLCPGTDLLDPAAPVDGGDTWTRGPIDPFPYPRPNGRFGIYYELRLPIRTARAQALVERHDEGWRICALE